MMIDVSHQDKTNRANIDGFSAGDTSAFKFVFIEGAKEDDVTFTEQPEFIQHFIPFPSFCTGS